MFRSNYNVSFTDVPEKKLDNLIRVFFLESPIGSFPVANTGASSVIFYTRIKDIILDNYFTRGFHVKKKRRSI